MRRLLTTMLLTVGVSLAWTSSASAAAVLLETITVPNNSATPTLSTTTLAANHVYQLQASGTASNWTADPSGMFNGSQWGVDALYCHVAWQCSTPVLWRNLTVNGIGFDQFGKKVGRLPYNASHAYTIQRTGVRGQLSFASFDAVQGSGGDNSGSYTVFVWDLGEVGAKVTYSFSGYANIVRILPRFQWGESWFSGKGVLQGALDGTSSTRQEPRFYDPNNMQAEVLSYSYKVSAHGMRKVLTLRIKVYASNDSVDCKVGTIGTITLVDDSRRMRNGQTMDRITHSYPVGACPTYIQGVTNANAAHLRPTAGGPGGGQFAKVSIKYQA